MSASEHARALSKLPTIWRERAEADKAQCLDANGGFISPEHRASWNFADGLEVAANELAAALSAEPVDVNWIANVLYEEGAASTEIAIMNAARRIAARLAQPQRQDLSDAIARARKWDIFHGLDDENLGALLQDVIGQPQRPRCKICDLVDPDREPQRQGEAVARLFVRGAGTKSQSHTCDLLVDLPNGTHELYTQPPASQGQAAAWPQRRLNANSEQQSMSHRPLQQPASQGHSEHGSIAHRLYCELGFCGDDPFCFLGADKATQDRWNEAVRTVLGQPASAAVADGWKLVPIQATIEMVQAGNKASDYQGEFETEQCWAAMLAAAPEAKEGGA